MPNFNAGQSDQRPNWAPDYPGSQTVPGTSPGPGSSPTGAGQKSGLDGYNYSVDSRNAAVSSIPVVNQPHTTAFSNNQLAPQAADQGFSGAYGHAERDPNAIRSYQGSDGRGAPSDLSPVRSDPRMSMGQTASVSDTGVSRVTYGNQAPAPKTF